VGQDQWQAHQVMSSVWKLQLQQSTGQQQQPKCRPLLRIPDRNQQHRLPRLLLLQRLPAAQLEVHTRQRFLQYQDLPLVLLQPAAWQPLLQALQQQFWDCVVSRHLTFRCSCNRLNSR
jgi:hypothetical protein